MNKYSKRIAILGAGGLGVCTALELASRGFQVDLYEEYSKPIRKASFVNEGKIHLGFIYAMDKDFYTSREMIIAALHFVDHLKRWIDVKPEELISTPFNYLVHKGSLMNGDQLNAHYTKCKDFFREAKDHYKLKYLDLFDSIEVAPIARGKFDHIANPEFIDDVFLTNEYSVEPRTIAYELEKALLANPSIQLILNARVTGVTRTNSQLEVSFEKDGKINTAKYAEVINSTWSGMLEIDRTMGIEPLYAWSFRYKFGNKILIPFEGNQFHSCTMVQGPFGDAVNFKDKGGFFSWYPIGRTGWSEEHNPPRWDEMYTDEERFEIFSRSFEQLTLRIPSLKNVTFRKENVNPVGGVIFALGNKDVDTESSKLHTRHEVGIRTYDGYHTVNTGKYTLIPYLAVKVADRIEGKS
ncbi:MAG: FAD-binding oxidoreductase [Algoriphagus sp.]|nr:FAD-binding oxidoreductase [Algoriphagus sp.]